jgi:adenylate kinase
MLLRQQMAMGTELGKQAAPILARGEYLPGDLMCPILAEWLAHQSGGWVLDGFPRSLQQAVFLDHWLALRDLRLDAAISLELSFDEILVRICDRVECPGCHWTGHRGLLADGGKCLGCGGLADRRADDDLGNFRKRYAEFVNQVHPVIEHYRQSNLLYSCDGSPPQDEVAARLLEKFTHPSLL